MLTLKITEIHLIKISSSKSLNFTAQEMNFSIKAFFNK